MLFGYNSKDPKDFTATDRLWQAIQDNAAAEALNIIHDEKPDVNDKRTGTTPLIAALRVESRDDVPDNESVVQMLITAGADVNEPAGNLCTPLTTALILDRPADVKRLLMADADPNGAELGGRLPLHIAIARNQTECVRLLLESGANIRDKGTEDKDMLEYARSRGTGLKSDIMSMLKAAEARYEQDLPGILQKAFERGTSQRFLPSKRLTLKPKVPTPPV